MHKIMISIGLLAAFILSMVACNTQVSDPTTLPGVTGETVPQSTATEPDETTEPTGFSEIVTVPPITITEPTQPQESQPDETTGATQPSTESTTGSQTETRKPTSYEMYNAMSAEEQAAFYNSFADPNDFFAWVAAAKKEYEDSLDQTIVDGNTNIDMGGK